MAWTPKQQQAINTRDRTLLVSAAAGSGKTATLTERIIQSILDDKNPGDIGRMLIVTYTNAAVEELRERVSSKIRAAAEADTSNTRLSSQLLRIKDAKIMTITSFCNTILRTSAESVGISPSYRIAEPSEAKIVGAAVLEGLINAAYDGQLTDVCTSEEFIELGNALSSVKHGEELGAAIDFVFDKLKSCEAGIDTLLPLIKEYDPTDFTAPENTGLGRYIIGYVKDAFAEYAYLLKKIIPLAGTEKMDAKNLALAESDIDFIDRALAARTYSELRDCLGTYSAGRVARPKPDNTTEFSARFAFIHDFLAADIKELSPTYFTYTDEEWRESYAALHRTLSVFYRFLKRYYADFAAEKKKRGICEFSDVERYAYESLWTPDGKRTELANELARRFDAIYVDEYQDVNALQNKIFEAISTDTDRFMVGDIKQSIYGFRAARPEIFAEMKSRFPELGNDGDYPAASIFMANNFRCDENVISFVNGIFDKFFGLLGDSIGYVDGDKLVFSKLYPEGSSPIGHVPEIHLIEKPDRAPSPAESEEDDALGEERESAELEAYYIAKRIDELIGRATLANGETVQAKDIAVLMRSVKGALANELCARLGSMGIRTSVVDTGSLFLDESVLLALSFLYCIDNPRRNVYLAALMCSPLFGFSADELLVIRRSSEAETLWEALLEYVDKNRDYERGVRFIASLIRYRRLAEGKRTDELLTLIYRESGLMALGARSGGRENLILLHSYARKYEQSDFKGLYSFISYVNEIIENGEEFATASADTEENAVRLMTVHKSKGLEFPVCILANTASRGRPNREKISFSDAFGIAFKLRDDTGLALVENPACKIIDRYIRRAEYDEELRVLYVALTRAREMLIIYGSCPKKQTDEYIEWARQLGECDSPYLITKAKTFLDIILAGRSCGRLTVEPIPAAKGGSTSDSENGNENGKNGNENTADADYTEKSIGTETDADEYVRRFTYRSPIYHLQSLPEKISVSRLTPGMLDIAEDGECDVYELLRREGILTPDEDAPNDTDDGEDVSERTEARAYLPTFFTGTDASESAKRGIATHTVMQFCDLDSLYANGVREELKRLVALGFISRDDATRVRIKELEGFVSSPLFAEMRTAKRLWREQRFNVKLRADRFAGGVERREALKDAEVLVQGVIDCVIEHEDGSLHLIDYKTDRVKRCDRENGTADDVLRQAHSRQLLYYADAVKLMFGRYPDKIGIFSLHLGREISVGIDND